MAKDLSVALKAISALAGFQGGEAISKLQTIADPTILADNKVKAAAKLKNQKADIGRKQISIIKPLQGIQVVKQTINQIRGQAITEMKLQAYRFGGQENIELL